MQKYYWHALLCLSLVSADQASKIIAHKQSICNYNIAWSISIAPGFFYIAWIAIFLLLSYLFSKSDSPKEKSALVFILSGAASNLFDRIVYGCVIDFIDLKIWPASSATRSIAGWPIFNLADVFIAIGVIILLFNIINNKSREAKP